MYACLLIPLAFNLNVSIQLLLNSTACVALGAIYSIKLIANKDHNLERKDLDVENEEDDESVSMSDALKFPIYASIALGTLYILFKNLDKNFLNFIFRSVFSFLGMGMIGGQVLRHDIHNILKFLPTQEKILVDKNVQSKFFH